MIDLLLILLNVGDIIFLFLIGKDIIKERCLNLCLERMLWSINIRYICRNSVWLKIKIIKVCFWENSYDK